MRKPLSSYHPLLYWLRVNQRRLFRHLSWYCSSRQYSLKRSHDLRLPFRYKKHTSKLIRRLGNSDIQLQYNKVKNLKIAVDSLNGILIKPGEYFSFCRLVGKPTKKRGFVNGMELSFGVARSGIGGGICQVSNLIHWLALHSKRQIVERANHSFDPFPDDGRVLPFGSGAAIFYNYIDLIIHNPTDKTFQIMLHVGDHQLEGELLCDEERQYSYRVYEKQHAFIKRQGIIYRKMIIWRDTMTKNNIGRAPACICSKMMYKNKIIVKYKVNGELITNEENE